MLILEKGFSQGSFFDDFPKSLRFAIRKKDQLLDELEKRTGLNKKYLIEKLKPKSNLDKDKS